MKTKFALIDEMNNVLLTSEIPDILIAHQEKLKNRRIGKSTRVIFTAIGSKLDTYILYKHRTMANTGFDMILRYLGLLNFDYELNRSKLTIKPKFSGEIRFLTEEDFHNMKISPASEYLVLRDLD